MVLAFSELFMTHSSAPFEVRRTYCRGPEKVLERMAEPVLVMGACTLQVKLQPFITLLLPEVPHTFSCSARDAVLALNF